MSFTSVTITGTIENTATTPVANATVAFQLSAPITDGITLIEPTLLTTTTNSSGQFSIAVPANDDPTTTPRNTSYAVTITAGTWTDSWSVIVPHSAAPSVDLFALAVLSPPSAPAQPYVATLEGLNGAVILSSPNSSLAIGTSGQAVTLQTTNNITISQQSANYTFALTDAGTEVDYTGTSAGTFTIPANSSVNFPVGTKIRCRQTNTGALTLSPATGVTLYNGSTTSGSVTLSQEVYLVEITQTAANTWATSWPTTTGGGGGSGYTAAPAQTISANTTLTGTYNLYPLLLNATANITAPRAPSSGADYLQYHIRVGTAGATPTILDAAGAAAVWVNSITPSWDTTAGDEYWVTANPNEAGTNWVWNTTAQVLKGVLLAANNLSDVVNPAQSLANLGGLPVVQTVLALGTSGTVTLTTPNNTTPDTVQTIAQSGALTLANWVSPAAGQSCHLRIVANGNSITFPTTATRWLGLGSTSGAGSAPSITVAGTYDFFIKTWDGTNYDWFFLGRFA